MMALRVPGTAMVVTTDVGEPGELHPRTKEPVGARLALAARAVAYGEDVEHMGPLYKSMAVEGDKAVVSFTHVGKGLEVRGDTLTGFAVAGPDGKFHPARAEVRGDEVVVWSDKVSTPAAVRFGWESYPVVNLWNKDGLPASPFRTDDEPPGILANRVMVMASALFLLTGVVALVRWWGRAPKGVGGRLSVVFVSLVLAAAALAGALRKGQQVLHGLLGEVETVSLTRGCLVFALAFLVLCHVRLPKRSRPSVVGE
jgi:hypothetical protein